VFSHAFYVLQRNDPAQFVGLHTRLDSLYFAITTLTTVGTGDIHAAGQVGRALVLVQMIFNVVFVATTASLLSTRVRESVANKTQERRTRKPR
jgi:voltage-gated potassium channel